MLVDTRRIISKSRATKYPISLSLSSSSFLLLDLLLPQGNIRASQRTVGTRVEHERGNETRSYHTGQVSIQRWRTGLSTFRPSNFHPSGISTGSHYCSRRSRDNFHSVYSNLAYSTKKVIKTKSIQITTIINIKNSK